MLFSNSTLFFRTGWRSVEESPLKLHCVPDNCELFTIDGISPDFFFLDGLSWSKHFVLSVGTLLFIRNWT